MAMCEPLVASVIHQELQMSGTSNIEVLPDGVSSSPVKVVAASSRGRVAMQP